MAKQNKDYGYDIQKLYLEMMLQNAETFVRCQSIFDYSLFDRKLQDTAQFINKYVRKKAGLSQKIDDEEMYSHEQCGGLGMAGVKDMINMKRRQ